MSDVNRPTAPVLTGIGLIAIGFVGLTASLNVPLDQYGRWGARYFPLAASGALTLLGVIEVWCGRRTTSPGAGPVPVGTPPDLAEGLAAERPARPPYLRIALLALIGAAYVWSMARFGYLATTAIAAPAALATYGVRDWWKLLLMALLAPAIFHVVFFELLGVFPPLGSVWDLLDVIRGH